MIRWCHRNEPTPARAGGLALAVVVVIASPAAATEIAPRFATEPWGLDTAARNCVVCHSLERGGPFRSAPNLYGIVGAEKARDRDWYGYSLALLKKGGAWTEDDLDAYLADARAFAPGTRKSIRIRDPEERSAIIDFLKTLAR